jgi:uncharacterized HAD superfamily protein
MRIGYDLDGVIARKKNYTPFERWMFKTFKSWYSWVHHSNQQVLFYPPQTEHVVIITARPETDRKVTEKWLKANDIHYNKLIMREKALSFDADVCAEYKAYHIKKEELDLYVEDEPEIFEILSKQFSPEEFSLLLVGDGKLIKSVGPKKPEGPFGDVWQDILRIADKAGLPMLLQQYGAVRHAFGVKKYGVPLQYNDGRDYLMDILEELLDAIAYSFKADQHQLWLSLVGLTSTLLLSNEEHFKDALSKDRPFNINVLAKDKTDD